MPSKPVVIMKWLGKNPELPAIILNSHMDVVPVFPEKWTHDPFGAHMDDQGRIYARGTQDMKSVGCQYMAAVRALKSSGYQPKRTVYLTFVPDEETGGRDWCEEAGGGIELEFEMKNPFVEPTKIDSSNAYWLAFKKALDDL